MPFRRVQLDIVVISPAVVAAARWVEQARTMELANFERQLKSHLGCTRASLGPLQQVDQGGERPRRSRLQTTTVSNLPTAGLGRNLRLAPTASALKDARDLVEPLQIVPRLDA